MIVLAVVFVAAIALLALFTRNETPYICTRGNPPGTGTVATIARRRRRTGGSRKAARRTTVLS